MIQAKLLEVLGYIWLAFGAYWMGFSLLRNAPAQRIEKSVGRFLRLAFLAISLALLFLARHRIPPFTLIILGLAWAALALYWTASGASATSGEFRLYRPLRLLVLALTFSLLFWPATAIGFLAARFLPESSILAIAGFVAALLGMVIALWARISLGRFWSDKVVLQSGHVLIRTGPYARMRHPIYSGVLLGILGTALLLDQWRGLLAFVLLLANYAIKAKKEEHLLAHEFGPAFADHASRTGFLLPRSRPAPNEPPHTANR